VFLVEYLGPILIHPVIFFLRPVLYRSPTPVSYPPPSSLQIISLALVYLHFMKRELETLYIHRFSASTMPLRNIFKNSFHYWIISGVFMAYFMYSPTSRTAGPINPLITYPGLALFAIGELGNLNAHYVLRNLRKEGTKERGIPQGLGFNLVTCPNYMFEAMAWFGITLVSQNWAVLVFAIVSIGQMAIWSKKKERNYRKEFGDKYQKKRYGLLPGIY
jgi:very-long-chain enoyl-CoA reductase